MLQTIAKAPTTLFLKPSKAMYIGKKQLYILFFMLLLPIVVLVSLCFGRYEMGAVQTLSILFGFLKGDIAFDASTELMIIQNVRLPRIILAMIVGAGLAMSGAALQTVFKNPLVGPQFLGFSGGAAFGGALAIFFGLGAFSIVTGAFGFAMIAVAMVFVLSGDFKKASVLALILSGIVITAFFGAATSLLTFFADPFSNMPAIVFWLMGSFAGASYEKIYIALIPSAIGGMLLFAMRWKLNLLALSDEEAKAFGANPALLRWIVFACVALITAASVAVAGEVGWVGLVVPYMARMIVGSDCRYLLPASALIGASFLVIIDTLSRSVMAAEIPIGILTAFVGAPIFFVLLRAYGKRILNG